MRRGTGFFDGRVEKVADYCYCLAMSSSENLDERLYRELFDYEKAEANAALRWQVNTSQEARDIICRAEDRLRYWVVLYIAAIHLFRPDPSDFERRSYQSEILKHCEACGRPELKQLFPRAKETAWKGIVQLAEQDLIGKRNSEKLDLTEKAKLLPFAASAKNFTVDKSSEDAGRIVAGELGNREFLNHLKSLSNDIRNDQFLRFGILSLWVHPDFPLWLMAKNPAVELLIDYRRRSGLGGVVTSENFEITKARLKKSVGLATNSTPVITGIRSERNGDRIEFLGYELASGFESAIGRVAPLKFQYLRC